MQRLFRFPHLRVPIFPRSPGSGTAFNGSHGYSEIHKKSCCATQRFGGTCLNQNFIPRRMKKLLPILLGVTAVFSHSGFAQNATTTPVGAMTITFPEVSTSTDVLTYFTLPLSGTSLYTSNATAVAADTLTFGNASWAPSQFATTPSSYYVRIMTGMQEGRILKVTGNTANTLTVSTDDETGISTALNTANFTVTTADIVELHQADTLASLFGDNISVNGTVSNPLEFASATRAGSADTITILDKASSYSTAYWFNKTANQWRALTGVAAKNDTPIFPDSALLLLRRKQVAIRPAQPYTFTGVVSTAKTLQKAIALRAVPTSLNMPVDLPLSALQIGGSWTKANRAGSADTVSIYNASTGKSDSYYQRTDNTWRLLTGAADVSSTIIPAGSVVSLLERVGGTGSAGYFSITLPYSLN